MSGRLVGEEAKFVAAAATGGGTTVAAGTGGATLTLLGTIAAAGSLILLALLAVPAIVGLAVSRIETIQKRNDEAVKATIKQQEESPKQETYHAPPSAESEKLKQKLSGEAAVSAPVKKSATKLEAKPAQKRDAKPDPKEKLKPLGRDKPADLKTKDKPEEKKLGRIYVTYTAFHSKTGLVYSGRTDMVVDLSKPLKPQAIEAMIKRYPQDLRSLTGFDPKGWSLPELDTYDVGKAVDRKYRYNDKAYLQMRGREQQLIDYHGTITPMGEAWDNAGKPYLGGAWSDTGKPYRTGNVVRGVAKDAEWGWRFHQAASNKWGELHPYTGYR